VVDTGYSVEGITEAIQAQLAHGKYDPADVYGGGDAGAKIADELAGMALTFAKIIRY
jgi:hypothetical protein